MNSLFSVLEKVYPQMVEWRRYFHMHPELSFHEEKTPATIASLLTEFGIEVQQGVGGRGVLGVIKGGKPGKTVALRADFDALPIQDEKDVSYTSQVPGVMHACGHDAHTATLLGVAKTLVQFRKHIPGTIILIHQFAEEIAPGGAKPMIEDGCLDGVDAIFGTHLWSGIPVGHIGYREGPIMASGDRFEIEIQGQGGHGASPHQAIDSVVVGSQLVQTLQQLVSRRINPLRSAVVSVGSFHAGDAYNIIADQARLVGTVRSFDEDVREQIIKELEQVTQSTCDTFGAGYRFKYEKGYPAVWNHPLETRLLADSASEAIGAEKIVEMEPVMASEDYAYYLQHVPGTFFFTGAGNSKIGANYPHHHPRFDIDERAMLIAGKTFIATILRFLNTESTDILRD